MSSKKKSENKERRRKEKRARKAAERARYESYRDQGTNSKSKRSVQKAKKNTAGLVRTMSHPDGECGNPGCISCFGISYKNYISSTGKPRQMPPWMYAMYSNTPNRSTNNGRSQSMGASNSR